MAAEKNAKVGKENPMKKIRVGKVTLSIGIGEGGERVEKAYMLAERLTECKPVKTIASRKARTFKIRRGLPIGLKVTMRNDKGVDFLKKVAPAIGNTVDESNFDAEGNFGFGIKEYLDIPGQKYDPKLGIFGMNVYVSLERPGYRIKRRKLQKTKLPISHRIKKNEAIEFVKGNLGLEVL